MNFRAEKDYQKQIGSPRIIVNVFVEIEHKNK